MAVRLCLEPDHRIGDFEVTDPQSMQTREPSLRRWTTETPAVRATIVGAKGGDEMVFLHEAGVEKEADLVASVEGEDAGNAVDLGPESPRRCRPCA